MCQACRKFHKAFQQTIDVETRIINNTDMCTEIGNRITNLHRQQGENKQQFRKRWLESVRRTYTELQVYDNVHLWRCSLTKGSTQPEKHKDKEIRSAFERVIENIMYLNANRKYTLNDIDISPYISTAERRKEYAAQQNTCRLRNQHKA